ncbi:MAG: hypothetical protein JXB13_13650 [Phycisphaerae bacterium]|nr:hypothetical protein [Phycisphaerae bacterium]
MYEWTSPCAGLDCHEDARRPVPDLPGLRRAAALENSRRHAFALTPGRCVGAEEQEDDGEPFAEKYPRRVAELEERFAEGERLTATVRERLQFVKMDGGIA